MIYRQVRGSPGAVYPGRLDKRPVWDSNLWLGVFNRKGYAEQKPLIRVGTSKFRVF